MNGDRSNLDKQYRTMIIIVASMLLASPVLYLVVAYILDTSGMAPQGFNEFVLYALLVIAVVMPAIIPAIEKMQLKVGVSSEKPTAEQAAAKFQNITIIKAAFIEAVYIFGLVVFILSGRMEYLWYFYPIGAIWTAIYWPRRDKFDRFIQKQTGPYGQG